MKLYDKRPVACRIAPFADRKDDTQYGIYNKADTSDQTEYTWIYHKRPVACRVAHLQDTKNNITKRTIDMTSDQTKSIYNKELATLSLATTHAELLLTGREPMSFGQMPVQPLRQRERPICTPCHWTREGSLVRSYMLTHRSEDFKQFPTHRTG